MRHCGRRLGLQEVPRLNRFHGGTNSPGAPFIEEAAHPMWSPMGKQA